MEKLVYFFLCFNWISKIRNIAHAGVISVQQEAPAHKLVRNKQVKTHNCSQFLLEACLTPMKWQTIKVYSKLFARVKLSFRMAMTTKFKLFTCLTDWFDIKKMDVVMYASSKQLIWQHQWVVRKDANSNFGKLIQGFYTETFLFFLIKNITFYTTETPLYKFR